MYCRYCGKEIADNSKYCNNCGKTTKSIVNINGIIKYLHNIKLGLKSYIYIIVVLNTFYNVFIGRAGIYYTCRIFFY